MGSGASSFNKERGKTRNIVVLIVRVAPLEKTPQHKNKFKEPAAATTKGETLGQANVQDNLNFYKNKIKSRPPPGYHIEEMLQWFGDFDKLKRNHSYIQWLFPIFESSGMNVHAQALQPHEAEAIRADNIAHGRVLKAFKMMLNFYGMKLDERSEKVTRDPHNWKDRFQHLNKSSNNYLKITRILRSIGFLGYGHLQYPWLQFILKESRSKNTLLPNLRGRCRTFWIDSLDNEEDQVSAVEIITMSEADFEKANIGVEDSNKSEADKEGGTNSHEQDREDEVDGKAFSKKKATVGKEDYNKPEADKEGESERHTQNLVDEVDGKANSKKKATNDKEDYNKPETNKEVGTDRHTQDRVDEVDGKANSKKKATNGKEDTNKPEADKEGGTNRHAQDREDEVNGKANSKKKATNGKEDYNKPEADKESGTNRHAQYRGDEVDGKANSKKKATNDKEYYNKLEADKEGESERHAQNREDEVGDKADSKDPRTNTQRDKNGDTDRVDSKAELEKDDSNSSTRSDTNNRDNEAIQLDDRHMHNFVTGEHPSLNF